MSFYHRPIIGRNNSIKIREIYFVTNRPIFLSRPDLVSDRPVARDILPFVADMPVARRYEKEVPNVLRLFKTLGSQNLFNLSIQVQDRIAHPNSG